MSDVINKNNYFGLSEEFSNLENSRVAIVPCPYEATTSYGKGTAKGPEAILEASQQVELFDDELWVEPYTVGIQTLPPVKMEPQTQDMAEPFIALQNAVSPIIESGRFPIILGGEHALSLGGVKACASRYPGLSILHIDAHADLRKSYDGKTYSHACAAYHMYKALSKPIMTQVGIRNISQEELDWIEAEEPNINIFWARNQDKWKLANIIDTLSDHVYLTIDVDGLDPSIMPSTGTPEPGGMGWYQLLELIKLLCVKKTVVAADIVELAPIANLHAPTFLAAKLAYKIIGYRFALDLGVTKKY